MSLPTPPWDVLICGAGPAGALCAIRLLRLRPGLRVLLLEAEAVPRPRPCGEFIAPLGMRLLAAGGVQGLEGIGCVLEGLALHGGRARLALPFPGTAAPAVLGCGVRREDLAVALETAARAAGASVRRGARVLSAQRDQGRWRIETASEVLGATMLIGADGRLSRIRHCVGLERACARTRYAVVARGVGMRFADARRCGEMHLSALGQIGVAPLSQGTVNLNLLLAPGAHRLLRTLPPARLMALALHLTPSLRERSRGLVLSTLMTTPSLPHRAQAVVADGVALVGDAAGFWDPFTGDGITQALLQAWALGSCLARCDFVQAPSARQLAPYARAWRAATRAKRSGMLEYILARRALSQALVGMLARLPALGRMLAHWTLPSRGIDAICSSTEMTHGSTGSPTGRSAGAA